MALEAQCLGSEFKEARGRYAGPFPSLACDPTLHIHRLPICNFTTYVGTIERCENAVLRTN